MIRPATIQDVPEILEIYAPYVENTTISFEYDVPAPEAFLQRFLSITEQFPWLVWVENGRILGYAYGSYPFERAGFAWCAEASIYLRPEARGKGIGRQLYAVLEELLTRQGYCLLYSLVTADNEASLRFHQKCGYRLLTVFPGCGRKFDRWLGLAWLEKRLKIGENPSAFPLPWMSIVQDAETFCNILDSLSLS